MILYCPAFCIFCKHLLLLEVLRGWTYFRFNIVQPYSSSIVYYTYTHTMRGLSWLVFAVFSGSKICQPDLCLPPLFTSLIERALIKFPGAVWQSWASFRIWGGSEYCTAQSSVTQSVELESSGRFSPEQVPAARVPHCDRGTAISPLCGTRFLIS